MIGGREGLIRGAAHQNDASAPGGREPLHEMTELGQPRNPMRDRGTAANHDVGLGVEGVALADIGQVIGGKTRPRAPQVAAGRGARP